MTIFYNIPDLPESLRPNSYESELSFIAPLPRKNYVINPSFEIDNIGETQPYNWDVGNYNYYTNVLNSTTDIGSIVTENTYSGFNAMRCNFANDTNIRFVYGRTQPITLPLTARKSSFFSTNQNKTLYRINGALSFYVFAPTIDAYTAFSLFNQTANTSRDINVQIYATVDANGEPTANFNDQQIITNTNLAIAVSKSTFYSEDVEPNYIGRRKNPEWTRYIVPFSTIFDYQKDNFIRFSIGATSALIDQNPNFLFYIDAVQVEFYDDDFPFPTTYLDGDLGKHDPLHPQGYYWEGANQKSISIRSIEAYSGGVLFNLQKDFLINVVNMRGFGLPTTTNNVVPYEYADGQQYVSTGIDSRKITINGYVSGSTALESNRATGILQYLLSKERSGISSLRRFYYRIPETICDGNASEYVFFDAVVESIKPDPESNNPGFNVVIQLNNVNIYYYTTNNVYYQQSALQTNTPINSTYGIKLFHAQGGNPITEIVTKSDNDNTFVNQSFFGHDDYELYCNGSILCWCELDNGCILFGGKFTSVSYVINGNVTIVQCNNIAMLNTQGQVYSIRDINSGNSNFRNGVGYFSNLTTPQSLDNTSNPDGNAVVRSIVQTNFNTVLVGGQFTSVIGRNKECVNIWHIPNINDMGYVTGANLDVEGGLSSTDNEGGVYTMLFVADQRAVYVGGKFTNSVYNTESNARPLKNAAIFYLDREYKWEPMWYGANDTVRTMSFFQNRYVISGGDFTSWLSHDATRPYLTQTRFAALYDTAISTPNNQRVRSLSSVIAINTSTSANPDSSSVFDKRVNKIITDPFGNAIISGRFEYIDMNDETLQIATQKLNANRIVRWDGFNRYTLMEDGVRASPMFYWVTVAGTISVTLGNTAVTGVGTNFTDVDLGAELYNSSGIYIGTIAIVNSTTSVTLTSGANVAVSAAAYNQKVYYIPVVANAISYAYTEVKDVCRCPYNNDVYAVGTFTNAGSIQSIGMARWTKNRWEAMDFEIQAADMYSVFVSKRGYGFVSYSTAKNYAISLGKKKNPKIVQWNLNNSVEPNLIVIDNNGLETQPVIELSNPFNNQQQCDLISIYNLTTQKSMVFNMQIFVGETITIDFSDANIRPKSNIRNRIINTLVGGGTFANFFLNEGKNVIKILGGQRGINSPAFVRPLQVKIRYHTRQASPYVVYENDIIDRNEELVGWTLDKSKLGLDTAVNDLITLYPTYNWLNNKFRLGVTKWGFNSTIVN